MTQDTRRNPPDRVHVVNVCAKGNDYYVVLSDNSEVEWSVWCNEPRPLLANPQPGPIDYRSIRERAMVRFSKTMAYLKDH